MSMPAGTYYIGDLCYVMTDAEWEQFCKITINGNKVLDGEFEEPIYDGVELLFPSIGSRHFLGAIPEVGDMCVVGWFATDTKGAAGSKRPAILAWLPKAYYLGQEWIPTQSFNEDEGLLNTPKDRKHLDRSFFWLTIYTNFAKCSGGP